MFLDIYILQGSVSVVCMPLSSKFLTESNGGEIHQYLAKIWTKCNSLLFLAHPAY